MRRKKHPGGRPRKMTVKVQKKILDAIQSGHSRDSAARLAGVHPSTFFDYQKEFAEFSDRVEQSDSKCKEMCLATIKRACTQPIVRERTRTKTRIVPVLDAKGRVLKKAEEEERTTERVEHAEGDWMAAAWLLERHFPQEYGRVDRHLLNVRHKHTGPLPQDYIDAVNRALGYTGQMIPIGTPPPGENNDDTIDLDVLPE